MSDLIPISEHLLNRGRELFAKGNYSEARAVLARMLRRSFLPRDMEAEANRMAGEIDLTWGKYKRARRHFAKAIRLQSHVSDSYVLYALAVRSDPAADAKKGLSAMARAIRLKNDDPDYWAIYGSFASVAGSPIKAIGAFRRAIRLNPVAYSTMTEIVDGLLAFNRLEDVRKYLCDLRFRYPRDGAVAEFDERYRFAVAARKQAIGQPAIVEGDGAIIRLDRASMPRPHMLRLHR